MSHEVVALLGEIAQERRLDKKFVIEALEESILTAIKKQFGSKAEFEVKVCEASGEISIVQKLVVTEDGSGSGEISLEEAKKQFGKDVKLGQKITVPRSLEEFGRTAVMVSKQILVQKIREKEKEILYQEFLKKKGEIVSGTIARADRFGVYVNISNRVEGFLPYREGIPKEKYYQGQVLKGVVIDVESTRKGPRVKISRTHPDFLRKLFEFEVPEILQGLVEIKAVAREPGDRAKIAVYSVDEKIDPVGACVGVKGSRVQAVVRELQGEKIDVVQWSPNPEVFIARALQPAQVSKVVIVDKEERVAIAVIPDDQRSLAIGKEGQNVRLAARLTRWKIDIKSLEQYQKIERERMTAGISVDELEGITPLVKKTLKEHGIHTVRDILARTTEQLMELPGIGAKKADKIFNAVKNRLEQRG